MIAVEVMIPAILIKISIVRIAFAVVLSCMLGFAIGSSRFENQESRKSNGNLNILCDPSIRSLEQELKICFKKQDDCTDLINTDVYTVTEELNQWKDKAKYIAEQYVILLDYFKECLSINNIE